MTKQQTTRDEDFFRLVLTWKKAYSITLAEEACYKFRLKELSTWDSSGNEEIERIAKITALQILLNQTKK